VGIKDRDYMRERRPAPDEGRGWRDRVFGRGSGSGAYDDDDDGGASSTPLWAKAVIVLLILSLVATAVVNNF
jgi:hypothetical protein